jgi:DNA-binding NarL/FixJ family response regulator
MPVVGFAVSGTADRLADYAEAGMAAFVPADARIDDLCDVLLGALRGEAACSPELTGALIRRVHQLAAEREGVPEVEALTDREHEIVALIDQGMSNKAIAAQLGIRVPTVKNHVHNLLSKLGVARRSEAAARVRWVRPGRRLV